MDITRSYLKELTYQINGAAIEVHKTIGPGFLESLYQKCMMHELTLRGIQFTAELFMPLHYKDKVFTTELRCDLYVESCLVVELKATETILPIHEAKLISYMKLLKAPKGIMLNFNCTNLYNEGQKTYVNEFFTKLKD
jgi:GxxExxY protein